MTRVTADYAAAVVKDVSGTLLAWDVQAASLRIVIGAVAYESLEKRDTRRLFSVPDFALWV